MMEDIKYYFELKCTNRSCKHQRIFQFNSKVYDFCYKPSEYKDCEEVLP